VSERLEEDGEIMSIDIREATHHDAAAVVTLIRELAQENMEASPVSEAYVLSYLSTAGNAVLLAEEDGRLAGLLGYSIRPNLYHAGDSCLLEELVVARGMRRQGVGGALVGELIHRAENRGCAEISVSTLRDNQRAIEFYRRHGFTDEALLLERHRDERTS
jgi:glucosamine-phosphate N-acetyltransferase